MTASGVTRLLSNPKPILGLLLAIVAWQSSAPSPVASTTPRYIVTSVPIDVRVGSRLCVAVDPADPVGVWWWQPGTSGCSSRSTGPGVFRGNNAAVVVRDGSSGVDVRFHIALHQRPESLLLNDADIHLVLADGYLLAPADGLREWKR